MSKFCVVSALTNNNNEQQEFKIVRDINSEYVTCSIGHIIDALDDEGFKLIHVLENGLHIFEKKTF